MGERASPGQSRASDIAMQNYPSLLDGLRTQYERRESVPDHGEVEGFQEIDARIRKIRQADLSAACTFAGVKGTERSRAPVAL
jgi:hypothetical protein